MTDRRPWVDDRNAALFTDLYELTMLQAYWYEGMDARATFSLYFRRLPERRNYMLACGLEDALHFLESVRFDDQALEWLRTRDEFRDDFVDWLAELRFTGDVWAMPEGTPVFPDEPLLEVHAPIAEAQLAESFVMNQVHLQTVIASKASRVVTAAEGRAVVDFGLRRMHGTDSAMKGARAYTIAGVVATSNVLAGKVYEVPITGTMAHSFIQAHEDERRAFRAFAELYPGTTLLVDTYDTLDGVGKVVSLARELGDDFRVGAIRLDSGDLGELARAARSLLDAGGLEGVEIFASGGLDEERVARLVADGAPIDGFGVGTRMGTSGDAPSIDMAYKLTEYGGEGRLKLSPGKKILPGPKQVFRRESDGEAYEDVIARADEEIDGRPLLEKVMENGSRLAAGRVSLDAARDLAAEELARLPSRVRSLEPADPGYPVEVSEALSRYQRRVIEEHVDPSE